MFFGLLLNKLKLKKWETYKPSKRQRILQKIEKKHAKMYGRKPLTVSINTNRGWHCYGVFEIVRGKPILKLNISLITDVSLRFHALETVFHEGRHAYQYDVINRTKISFFDFKAKRWQKNWKGYISSREDAVVYSMQAIERDAQKYTIKRLNRLRFKYRNEPDFERTLEALKYRYDKALAEAKEKLGPFYGLKINSSVSKRSKQNARY